MISRGRLAIAAVLGLVAIAAWTTASSGASFTASKSNPGNSFTASSSFPGIRVASGSYTGTGVDNRAITGVGFQPDVVIVKSDDNSGVAEIRTSTMAGDNTKPMTGNTALTANLIQSLTSDGFTLGTDIAGAAALGLTTCQALWFRADDDSGAREPDFQAFTQMDVLTIARRLRAS